MIGKTVSHYRILEPLGSGGMGVVYSGEDTRLGRPVALKFVPEELAKDPAAVERLKSEARTASALNHANICTIYDIGEEEGHFFIVMELLKGRTLRQRLGEGPLKPIDVIDLGIHVADALDAAHHRDIIHRDIKPANLFLVERGQIKILDFGLAKLVSHATEASTTGGMTRDRTAVGITLGTVAYMSPEQVTGEDLDARTDLFSLGVVLYEAITGQQPFTGKTSAVIFSAILTRAPVAPIIFNPEVPLRLQEVINNCLEKDRELRYQDAAGLRADLKRLRRDLESGQSGVFRISGSAPVGAWEHTHATAPHAAAPGSGATHRSPGSGSAPIETMAPSPAATSRKSNAPLIGAILVATAAVLGTAVWIASRSDAPSPSTEPAAPSTSSRTPLALATASLQSKDYRAALQYADEAIRLAPGDRDAIRIRDAARASLARFDEAVALANQRIVAADPNGATNALETARAIDPTALALNDLATRIAQLRRTPETASQEVASARPSPPPTPRPQPRANVVPPSRADTGRGRSPELPPAAVTPPPATVPSQPEPPRPAPPEREPAPPPATVIPPPVAPRPTPPPADPVSARPAPPPPEAAPASPPAQERREPAPGRGGETDDAAIRRIIATYARAIENKDLQLFRSVKPNMSAEEQRRIEEGFRAVTSQQVNIVILSLEQHGQEASVRIRRRDTILAGGREQTSETQQTLTFTRAASGWVIREIGR
jgi:serine/threonine protein kinase